MLSVIGMKQYIYPKIQQNTQSININKLFIQLICEYINNNAEIKYVWNGVNSLGIQDPITMFTAHSIGYGNFELSKLTDNTLAINYWNINMSKVLKTDLELKIDDIFIPDTWVFPKLTYSLTGLLNIQMNKETTFESASTNFCTKFLSEFKSKFINTIAIPGTHGLTYRGTATMVSIT